MPTPTDRWASYSAGHDVTYRVDRVHRDKAIGRPRLEPGATTVVTYGRTHDLLVPHHRYRVVGWASSSGHVESQIAHEFHGDCGTGKGTTALDGSFPREHVDSSGFWAALVIVVVGGALLGLHTVVARRRDAEIGDGSTGVTDAVEVRAR